MDAFRRLERENVRVYSNVKETGRELGRGSFGCVVEISIGAGKFAGKKIHQALVMNGDPYFLIRECKLMSELIHPNITKFWGVCKLPTSSVPVLVMELMEHSMEDIVDNLSVVFPYGVALSDFIDIAHGLAYLHSRVPRVLHRDLTARNVLLDRAFNAKITDFGNSRIVDAVKVSKTMTQAPGTLVYMPPEALEPHTKYGDRLDTFSFGHLALYSLIRQFPRYLLPATYLTDDGILVARTEVERRKDYMAKLEKIFPQEHHFYQLIIQCLHNSPEKRPQSTELLHWLQDIQRLELEDFDGGPDEPVSVQVEKERMSSLLQQRMLHINTHPEELEVSFITVLR